MRQVLRFASCGVFVTLLATQGQTQSVERVSVASDSTQGNLDSALPSVSADGRYVAFLSRANNLVPGDTNGTYDVFVRDRVAGTTERLSVASNGTQGNEWSWRPSISADGRYVAFRSMASNLVAGDTSGVDVFVRDRLAGVTERVSVTSDGAQGGGSSDDPSVSADGRYVAFGTSASNLVPGDTNGALDVVVRDRLNGITELVSVATDGTQGDAASSGASISADGRYVAFLSEASNLVPGDTNGANDVFVRDRLSGATERVSVASDGTQGDGSSYSLAISADGRYVAFHSVATNLVPDDTNGVGDVFVRDRFAGITERVSVASGGTQGNDWSWSNSSPSISADGRYVVFESTATNLVPGDTNGDLDVFVRDRLDRVTELVSLASNGSQADAWSSGVSISADGRYVAFGSNAGDLVPGDTNGAPDVFTRDRYTPATRLFCFGDGNGAPCPCFNPGVAPAGCGNSSGFGAKLLAAGSTSAWVDDLLLRASNLLPGRPAMAFVGLHPVNGGAGAPFGSGLRCVWGGIVRLGVLSPDSQGTATWGPGLGALAGWHGGDVRRFQVWYRDPEFALFGCVGFNLSNGLEVAFH